MRQLAGALDEVRPLCAEIREIGHDLDEALARCRMATRRIRATCRTALQQGGGDAELLESLMELADETLKSGLTTTVDNAPEGD